MASEIAPPKVTAGGGFGFEDKAAAYFLSCLLCDRPPFDAELGTITRIDFQTRVDGWFLDDVLLTLASSGVTRKVSLSVKSNQQFSSAGAPADFVKTAWEQFLHEGSARFDKTKDLVGLATAPLQRDLKDQLDELLSWSRAQDPIDLPLRLSQPKFGSKLKRELFASFACPKALAGKHSISDKNTGELLKHFQHLEFDFDSNTSNSQNAGIENCRSALASGSLPDAELLWNWLAAIAAKYRPSAGFFDLHSLLTLVKHKFPLKVYPHYAPDWDRLVNQTKNTLGGIQDKIGKSVSIPRTNQRAEVEKGIGESKTVAIIGPSGTGKTVVAKFWAQDKMGTGRLLWWNATSFDVTDFAQFESKLGLSYPLAELFNNVPDLDAFVVIDGIDRVYSDSAFQVISALGRMLDIENPTSPWRIVVTCQPEEWPRVQRQLIHTNFPLFTWKVVPVNDPEESDLSHVWEAFPSLRPLTLQRDVRSLLVKPKVLDLLACRLSEGATVDTSRWVGESDLVEWFWETEVSKPPHGFSRSQFLQLLGETQADNLVVATPLADIATDLSPLQELASDRLCRVHNERISFGHDLYGDWSRQRLLLGKEAGLSDYIEHRVSSPLWHRALRLHGLHLLERHADLSRWRGLLEALGPSDGSGNLAQDILLEAAVFSVNPLPLLDKIWPDLIANNGFLLGRLLIRFLHVATLPNPLLEQMLGADYSLAGATYQRIPYWPYWLPMIQFLSNHSKEALSLAPREAAQIADIWLRSTETNWPLRKQAAELALALGAETLEFQRKGGYVGGDLDEVAYRATLAAAPIFPDMVAAFARKASGRVADRVVEIEVQSTLHGTYRQKLPPPWPDGPSIRVDSAFQKICLETDALFPLVISNPSLACEVLLALLIEEPQATDPFHGSPYMGDEDLGIEYVHQFYPPFYTSGPFLFFLRNAPSEGLELIIRLISFASERWSQKRRDKGQDPPSVAIEISSQQRRWFGDYHVYCWYRDRNPCPDPVVAALMALEKWLYDEIDARRPVTKWLKTILDRSHSVAFAGVLSAVGRKHVTLFADELRPILTVPEFLFWEFLYVGEDHSYVLMGMWNSGAQLQKFAHEWLGLPHRKLELDKLALHLFLFSEEMRPILEAARNKWLEQFQTIAGQDQFKSYLEQLLPQFDLKNYTKTEKGWQYKAPQELIDKNVAALQEQGERHLLLTLPMRLRRILDEGNGLNNSDLEKFWALLERIERIILPAEDDDDILRKENAICGAIAVLLKCHRDWLKEHPAYEEICIKRLSKILENPPPQERLTIESDITDYRWDSFMAEALPILWSEDPQSQPLRRDVALLACDTHYKTVEILFAAAARRRSELGDNFRQLQHFIVRWSAVRWKASQPAWTGGESIDFQQEFEREAIPFIAGTLPPQIPSWGIIANKIMRPSGGHRGRDRRVRRENPGLYLTLIQAAYNWLPTLDKAKSKGERAEWVKFLREALDCTVRTLSVGLQEEEIDSTPYDSDQWVFNRIAVLLPQLQETETPAEFWKPVINLGPRAHYWVNSFLGSWFLYGLKSAPVSDDFVRIWMAMLDFTFSAPRWNHSRARAYRYRLDELWNKIMGFGHAWAPEHKFIISKMQSYYGRWATAHMGRSPCAAAFVRFIRDSAAEPLLQDGLVWVANAARTSQRHFWDEHGLQDDLASLLETVWRSHRSKLLVRGQFVEAFKELLKGLADRQNRLGLALMDQVKTTI